jgi:hypothetical protein
MKIILSMAVIGYLLFGGCITSHAEGEQVFSNSLIAVSGARNIQYSKFRGTDQLSFEIEEDYPAKRTLWEISKNLEEKGWKPLSEDYLNPGRPSSHIRGWSDFIDATKSVEIKVHQWLAQWENRDGDIFWCTLSYSYSRGGSQNLKNLSVSEIYIPANLARTAKARLNNSQERTE